MILASYRLSLLTCLLWYLGTTVTGHADQYGRARTNVIACYQYSDWAKYTRLVVRGDALAVTLFLAERQTPDGCFPILPHRVVYIELRGLDNNLCVRPIGDFRCAWTNAEYIDGG